MLACNSIDLIQISNLDENLKVIGPIGSGKTTVLKNIALGLEKVLVFDTCGEYGELEKQTNNVKVVTLTRNETKYSFECELKEEQIKLAEKYTYIIIDEPIHINRDQLIFFLEHMKTTDSKVITTFMPTSTKEFIEDEVTKYFPYVITLNSHFRESEDFEKMIKKIGGISIPLPLDNTTINPLDGMQKSDDFNNNKNSILIGKAGKGRAWKLRELIVDSDNDPLYGELKEVLQECSSVVINDPKGLLYGELKEVLQERGYQIEVLDLANPIESMKYNPLQIIKDVYKKGDYETAHLICKSLTNMLYYNPNTKDPFWQQNAMSLCNALILTIVDKCIREGTEDKIMMSEVANMLSELGLIEIPNEKTGEDENALDMYFQELPADSIAKMEYANSNFSKRSTRGVIFTETLNGLSIFSTDEIAKLTSQTDKELERVEFDKIAIFIITQDQDAPENIITSIFVRQLHHIIIENYYADKRSKCNREVVFILNDFDSMPAIEGMHHILSCCGGRNMRFNLIMKEEPGKQLIDKYGDNAISIINNTNAKSCNKMYIRGIPLRDFQY